MTIFKKIIIGPLLLTLMFMGIFIYFYNQISIVIDSMSQETKSSSMAVKQVHMDSIFQLMELAKESSFNPLLGPEPDELTIILSQLMQYDAIQSAYFVDMDERILADGTPHSDLEASKFIGQTLPDEVQLDIKHDTPFFDIIDGRLVYSHPFDNQGDPIGRLQVIISLGKLNKIQANLLDKGKIITKESRDKIRAIMIGAIVIIILSFFIAVLFIRRIITNLNLAVNVAQKVSKGNLDINFEITSMDETGTLLTAMQVMVNNVRQANKTLEKSEEKYRNIFERAIEGIFQTTLDARFISVNHSMAHMFGYDSPKDLISTITDIAKQCHVNPADHHKITDIIQEKGHIQGTEIRFLRKDGSMFWGAQTMRAIRDTEGELLYYEGSLVDITERMEKEKLETELSQFHKMETIGTLAGGIAHDFNNILSPIVGHTEMLLEDVSDDSPFRGSLNEIYTGALRARDLVKQILTFSRQKSSELKLMKMHPVIKEALKLIRSTIPTTIEIKQDIQTDCGAIKADPTQIHQIIMNLATNAYHAMEESGGVLKVNLKQIELGEQDVIDPEMKPGTFVCLTIADTGMGIDSNVRGKIFDPFFTTKEQGKGTGMGLSVVHGIVKSMRGAIKVYSKPEKGTEFHVYLPVERRSSEEQLTQTKAEIQGGTERILLVDDEEAIVFIEKQMLERLGYQVVSHTSSVEALEAFRANPDKFDVVISDMAMPNMSGNQLVSELINIRPDIPVVLCTGFSEKIPEEKAKTLGIKGFLMKPIVRKDLSKKIREVLDEPKTQLKDN